MSSILSAFVGNLITFLFYSFINNLLGKVKTGKAGKLMFPGEGSLLEVDL